MFVCHRNHKSVETLNDEQREAVEMTEGPVLVLAGAGTGKTRVITHRIVRLLEKGTAPGDILAVTFTRKAAREMKERVDAFLGGRSFVSVLTFHALGFRILRDNQRRLGFPDGFGICDDARREELVEELLEKRDDCLKAEPRQVLFAISAIKNGMPLRPPDPRMEEIAREYDRLLRERSEVDLDDLVRLPTEFLDTDARARGAYEKRWRYILIDEYQDTNFVQYRLTKILGGPSCNICAVGDDDQSIYRFRGADVTRILDFPVDFPGTKIVTLEDNYRSYAEILDAANAVIEPAPNRHPKRLRSRLGSGVPVEWRVLPTNIDEWNYIVDRIDHLARSGHFSLSDMAVLVRMHRDAVPLVDRLRKRHIRCNLTMPGSDEEAALQLLTLHASKGLEYPVVFLPCLEDGRLPHMHALEDGDEAIEEERRLLYVGITRAKKRLFLSSAAKRERVQIRSSCFLAGLKNRASVNCS